MKKTDGERRLSIMALVVIVALGVALVAAVLLTNGADEEPKEMTPEEAYLVAALALETNSADTIEALCHGLAHEPDRLEYEARVELGQSNPVTYEVWVLALASKCLADS